jgi:hypothetical protein
MMWGLVVLLLVVGVRKRRIRLYEKGNRGIVRKETVTGN